MAETEQKIKAAITELEKELRNLPSLDKETRQALQAAVRDIQTALGPDDSNDVEPQSLMERLEVTAKEFEGSHPTLTGILMRLVDGLGQMGI